MIKIFKTFSVLDEIPKIEKKCWLNVINPTQNEIEKLIKDFNLPLDSIQDILDADEMPRLEFDDDYTLVIMRIPVENLMNGMPYQTIPLGIFITKEFTITICNHKADIFEFKQKVLLTNVYDFVLTLFIRSGTIYLKYLKQINIQTTKIESDLEKSVKNSELSKLLKIEKCLVYFITGIKSNEIVLAKLKNSKKIVNQMDEDLLEDAIIENRQAQEMAEIHSNILSGMMDAFASVISNNLNVVMKQLTLISILLMIPTLIASYYGMNVPNYFENVMWIFPTIVGSSLLIGIISVIILRKRRW